MLRPKSSAKWIMTEMDEYQNRYPGKVDDPKLNDNLRFYENDIPFKPRGVRVSEVHRDWWGDYRLLERHRSYIQWLFPVREPSRNKWAQELQPHEAKAIRGSIASSARVLKSYEMMLDFYGMRLKDELNGAIERADNWQDRFKHLNSSYHNYLRITRMLKCLGELGYERLKAPFLEFVLHEAIEHGTLSGCLDSCMHFWVGALRSSSERKRLLLLAENLMKIHNKRGICCVIGPAVSAQSCCLSDCVGSVK
ncbi:Opioid growth factor receptor-like protein 1 [Lamellibrachia satsuma]|nr:Opioid growth factor receptor-like protein 1 [Lamellibrachia satsuma]